MGKGEMGTARAGKPPSLPRELRTPLFLLDSASCVHAKCNVHFDPTRWSWHGRDRSIFCDRVISVNSLDLAFGGKIVK
jgi:hypothetical protein